MDPSLEEYLKWRQDGSFEEDVRKTFHSQRKALSRTLAPSKNGTWQRDLQRGVATLVFDASSNSFRLKFFDVASKAEHRVALPQRLQERLCDGRMQPPELFERVHVDEDGGVQVETADLESGMEGNGEEVDPTPKTSVEEAGAPRKAASTAVPTASMGVEEALRGEEAAADCENEEGIGEEQGEKEGRKTGVEKQLQQLESRLPPIGSASAAEWVKLHQKISVYVVTWNMEGRPLPATEELRARVLPLNKFCVVVIGTEECERSIAASAMNPSKEKWEASVHDALGADYVKIAGHTLQATNLVAFAHRALLWAIHGVKTAAVPTGIGNTLGNKGGIGISFMVGTTSLLFMNAHMSASRDADGRQTRDSHFRRISSALSQMIGPKTNEADAGQTQQRYRGEGSEKYECAMFHFDRVIFSGDFNYRLDSKREFVDSLLQRRILKDLWEVDQLNTSRKKGSAFAGYSEGPLEFMPTYKYDKGCDTYDSGPKQRTPAWTDRVLYKESGAELLEYNCYQDERLSDHRPVYAVFLVDVDVGQHVEKADKGSIGDSESEVCTVQ